MIITLSRCDYGVSAHLVDRDQTVVVTTPAHRHDPQSTTYDVELWRPAERHTLTRLDDVDVALGVAAEIAELLDEHGHTPGALVIDDVIERVRARLHGGSSA